MATLHDLPEIVAGYPVTWQGSRESDVKFLTPDNLTRPEGGELFVGFMGHEIPLTELDWSWPARFRRMRKYLRLSKAELAALGEYSSLSNSNYQDRFPKGLKLAVRVWERMHQRHEQLPGHPSEY